MLLGLYATSTSNCCRTGLRHKKETDKKEKKQKQTERKSHIKIFTPFTRAPKTIGTNKSRQNIISLYLLHQPNECNSENCCLRKATNKTIDD